jgi:hypothetical protein
VWLKMDATAGPSSIQFGFTDPRLTTQGGLIVWPHGPRQVGFCTARGGTPPSLIDHRHGLSSQRLHLAISGRSGTAGVALSEKSPYPRSLPENPNLIALHPEASRRMPSRNGFMGAVVLATSSSARASLFAR